MRRKGLDKVLISMCLLLVVTGSVVEIPSDKTVVDMFFACVLITPSRSIRESLVPKIAGLPADDFLESATCDDISTVI